MNKRFFSDKGITLVALVVTIIVLLILAGVTITLALQSNGILERAGQAREAHLQGEQNDLNYLDEADGEMARLEAEIGSGNGGAVGSGETKEPVISKDTGAIGAPVNYDKYGEEVTNYTANGMKWRLFYEDENNVYLISETTSGGYPESKNLQTEYFGKSQYSSGASVSDQGKALLPLLGGETSSSAGTISIGTNSSGINLLTTSNLRSNILGVAYLCDTSDEGPWAAYKTGSASWAMGAPTIELFTASFNATHQGGKQIQLTMGSDGYLNTTGGNWLQETDNKGIYNLTSYEYWWLAAPDGSGGQYMVAVAGYGGYINSDTVSQTNVVRPIVCFQKSNFQYTLAS